MAKVVSSEDNESLFFHEQRNTVRHYRRLRKEPDELPQALRYFKYANLNPRIAAFLGKQDPRMLRKKRGENAKENEEGAAGDGDKELDTLKLPTNLARHTWAMGVGTGDVTDRNSLTEEIDDQQKFQFEEMTFAAPNILRELSDQIEHFLLLFRDPEEENEDEQPAVGSTTRKRLPGTPADMIPKRLAKLLCQDWTDVTANTEYTKRVWQTNAYRQLTAPVSTRPDQPIHIPATADPGGEDKSESKMSISPVKSCPKQTEDCKSGKEPKKKIKIPATSACNPIKPRLFNGIMKPRRDQSSIKISDGTNKRLGSTMTFCLSSRKAYEAGWVVEREDYEADRASLLAWMSNRIKGAVKQKEQEEEVARKLGHRKPSFVRYYGDSRRDQLKKLYEKPLGRERTKTKKPTGIPQLSSITEEEDRGDKLMVQLADGSITVHYPASGDIAIVASAVSDSPGQFYVNCFDKNSERTCLGTFTPTGKACCYRTNGIPGLLLTDEGGIIKSDTDETIKRWLWPPNPKEKLCEPISYQLNREMHVKIRGKRQMTLVFTSHRETVKIQVGVEKEAANKAGKGKDKRRIQPAIKKQGKSPKIEELKRDLYFASKSFELDQRAEADLEKMQEHAKQIVEHWMESYRQTLGIPPPEMNKITELPQVKTPYRRSNSANMPVYIINQMEEKEKLQSFRCPSAPLQHSFRIKQNEFLYSSSHKAEGTNKKSSKKKKKAKESQKEKPSKTALNNLKDAKSCKINVEENSPENLDDLFAQISEKRMEVIRSSSVYSSSNSTTSSKCDFLEFSSQLCPLVTRTEIENIVSKYQTTPGKVLKCRCSKNKIPSIHDLELDYFLSHIIPKHQMVVIYITNSLYPECNYYERMLESVYIAKNKNRSIPCLQSHKDEYRILTYDLAIANQTAHRSVPLLLARHNVVPGMTLIYCRSKLLFANSIFNGYGTTRSDFLKQISISSLQRKQKCYLPSDYRFQPAQGEAGPRMPWGGEMGGVGVDRKGNPGLMLSTAVGDLRQSKARLILNGAPHMHGITTHPNLTDSSSSISSKTSFPKLKDSNVAVSYSILSEYSNSHAPLVEVKRSNKKHKKKNNNSNLPYIEPFVLSVS